MPGPAPNPDARRRNARVGTVKLPAEGRKGAPPEWPFGGKAPTMWAALWAKPQAVMWERQQIVHVVARYCLLLSDLDQAAEVRQLEDRLGLNPKAMRTLMWEVAADEVAEARASAAAPTKRRTLKVVGADAVAAD